MKKVILGLIVIMVLIFSTAVVCAATSVSVSSATAQSGDTVTIYGNTDAAPSIIVRITDEYGNIVYFNAVTADGSGDYSTTYVVASDMSEGILTVTAGSGSDVATTTITIGVPEVTPTPVVYNNPQTGNANNTVIIFSLLILSAIILITYYLLKRKKTV